MIWLNEIKRCDRSLSWTQTIKKIVVGGPEFEVLGYPDAEKLRGFWSVICRHSRAHIRTSQTFGSGFCGCGPSAPR